MSNWKPTEGLRRAEPIVQRLIEDSATANLELRDPVFAHHVVTVLAGALDQALADGSEMDALASVVGNGHVATSTGHSLRDAASVVITGQGDRNGEYRIIDPDSPKKRGGRPKGSKNKKAKAGKPEAEAAT